MRTKDRLPDLQRLADENSGIYNDTVEVFVDQHEGKADIQNIFKEVDRMRTWILDVEANTQLMRRIYTDQTFHFNKDLQDQLDCVITQSNSIGLKICGALRQFEPLTRSQLNTVEARIARLQYASTRRLYAEALDKHQKMLQSIREGQYNLLQEQIKLTNLSITDDECQELLETKNISLFVNNIEAETAAARLALRDVEARHDELLKVERALTEVRELFVQMAHLVAQQQELVDTVEYYATQATALVEGGQHQLKQGTVTRTKARNKKIGLVVCLVSGFLIVLFVLIVT